MNSITMKKDYIIPEALPLCVAAERPLAASDQLTSSGDVTGIKYGGTSDGSVMPEVKRSYDVWDED